MSEIYVRCDMRTYHAGFKAWAHTVFYFHVESPGYASAWDLLRSFHFMVENDLWIVGEWTQTLDFTACIVSFKSYAIGEGFSKTATWPLLTLPGSRIGPLAPYVVDSGQARVQLIGDPFLPGHFISIPWTYDSDWGPNGMNPFTKIAFRNIVNGTLQDFVTYAGYICSARLRKSDGTFVPFSDARVVTKMKSLRTRRARK